MQLTNTKDKDIYFWINVLLSNQTKVKVFDHPYICRKKKGRLFFPLRTSQLWSSIMLWGCFAEGVAGVLHMINEKLTLSGHLSVPSKGHGPAWKWKLGINGSLNEQWPLAYTTSGHKVAQGQGIFYVWWSQNPDLSPIQNLDRCEEACGNKTNNKLDL